MRNCEIPDDEWFDYKFWDGLGYNEKVEQNYSAGKSIQYPVNFCYDFLHNINNSDHAVLFLAGHFMKDMFDRPCVYLLYEHSKEELENIDKITESTTVYIGVSESLLTRISQHRLSKGKLEKKFDSFGFLFTNTMEDAFKIEEILIGCIQPKYNKSSKNYVKNAAYKMLNGTNKSDYKRKGAE
jgi:hypothetical protein